MNPYPFVVLNHFTVPIAISQTFQRKRRLNERDSSADLAASRRQKAVAEGSQQRQSASSVKIVLTAWPPAIRSWPLPVALPGLDAPYSPLVKWTFYLGDHISRISFCGHCF